MNTMTSKATEKNTILPGYETMSATEKDEAIRAEILSAYRDAKRAGNAELAKAMWDLLLASAK